MGEHEQSDPCEWVMQVRASGHWCSVGPTGGQPYTFGTAEAAAISLRVHYPDQVREDRLDHESERTRVLNTRTGEEIATWRLA